MGGARGGQGGVEVEEIHDEAGRETTLPDEENKREPGTGCGEGKAVGLGFVWLEQLYSSPPPASTPPLAVSEKSSRRRSITRKRKTFGRNVRRAAMKATNR
ncbi:unnamed protein product [Ectocarpus sp. 4 AP-2014]